MVSKKEKEKVLKSLDLAITQSFFQFFFNILCLVFIIVVDNYAKKKIGKPVYIGQGVWGFWQFITIFVCFCFFVQIACLGTKTSYYIYSRFNPMESDLDNWSENPPDVGSAKGWWILCSNVLWLIFYSLMITDARLLLSGKHPNVLP